jgi:crotonobetainyl-CoA:carnitine CoA-transferase CaiB-like acyl-CoA transferase
VRIFKELVRETDVMLEDFEPGAISELALSYEALREMNSRLIMTSISDFGQTRPYRGYKATNLTPCTGWAGQCTPNGPLRSPQIDQ